MTARTPIDRRTFLATAAAAALAASGARGRAAEPFRLRYLLNAAMYGTMDLATIVPEVRKTGAEHIDIWPKPHGNQREQLAEMGPQRFAQLLASHGVKLGAITRYDLMPFKLGDEMALCQTLGAKLIVGGVGSRSVKSDELTNAMKQFVERVKPHAERAAEHGLTLAVENHVNSLLDTVEAVRCFNDVVKVPNVGLAFAPHHLPQDAALQAKLIEELGPRLVFFYAQQHGKGSKQPMPLEDELLQMPGRGPLDFGPLVAALKRINYAGFVEIFMHPVPRGRPILPSADAITAEINRSRNYLEQSLAKES